MRLALKTKVHCENNMYICIQLYSVQCLRQFLFCAIFLKQVPCVAMGSQRDIVIDRQTDRQTDKYKTIQRYAVDRKTLNLGIFSRSLTFTFLPER